MSSLNIFIFGYWHDSRWKKFVGATVKIWDLADNLSNLGNDVVLFLPKYKFNHDSIPFKLIEIPFINLPIVRTLSFSFLLILYLSISFFKKRPDIIYMRRMNSIIPALYAKLRKAKFLFEVNDDPYKKEYHEGLMSIFRLRTMLSIKQDEINLKFCDKALIITKALSEKIFKFYPNLNNSKILIIPSGANTKLFRPLNKSGCRFKLGLNPKDKIIGFAGSLLKHQGIDTLIDAAPSIIKQEPTAVFIVIGEGPMKRVWMEKVDRMDLSKAFMFTGQVNYLKMPTWIAAMDVCVAPSLRSSGLRSPVKIFDYMACGRPVVSSEIPGTTDVFSNSRAIKLVDPENSNLLADTLVDLLHNNEEVETMSQEGRLFIEKNFDRREIAKKILHEININPNL